jgi:hypothetical protein
VANTTGSATATELTGRAIGSSLSGPSTSIAAGTHDQGSKPLAGAIGAAPAVNADRAQRRANTVHEPIEIYEPGEQAPQLPFAPLVDRTHQADQDVYVIYTPPPTTTADGRVHA